MNLDRMFFSNMMETILNLRPDVVLQQSKTMAAVKLIVPWEESCKEAHESKNFSWQIARAKDDALGCFLLRIVAEGSQRCESWSKEQKYQEELTRQQYKDWKKRERGRHAKYGTAVMICARRWYYGIVD